MKKIIFYTVILIVFAGIVYVVYDNFFNKEDEVRVSVVLLSSDFDANYIQNVSEKINAVAHGSDAIQRIFIEYYLSPGLTLTQDVENGGDFVNEESFKKNLVDSLKAAIKKAKKLTPEDANTQIEAIVQAVNNGSPEESKDIFLLGSFPDCYTSSLASKASELIKKRLKGIELKNKNIHWMIKSNSDEPEQLILKSIKDANLSVFDLQLSTSKRVCPVQSSKNVEIAILSKMDDTFRESVMKKILLDIETGARIRITSMNGVTEYKADNQATTASFLNKNLSNQKSNTFLEARTILIQTFNYLENSKDTTATKLFIVGNLKEPTEGEKNRLKLEGGGLLSSKEQMKNIGSKKNLKYEVLVTSERNNIYGTALLKILDREKQ